MADSQEKNPVRKWRPAPPELIAVFERAIEQLPEAQQRKMFGYPCAFVNGNMFTGLHQENMILRLSEADRAGMLEIRGAALFEPMPGRAMKEYVTVPGAILKNPAELKKWLAKSFTYASSLPPKAKKKAGGRNKAGTKNASVARKPAAAKKTSGKNSSSSTKKK